MSAISKPLELQDRFSSTLDRYISKMKKAVEQENEYDSASQRLAKSQEDMAKAVQEWEDRLKSAASAGEGLVGSLTGTHAAFMALIEDIMEGRDHLLSIEDAMALVEIELERNGYAWSEYADGLEKWDLVADKSFSQLEKLGYIVKETADKADQSVDPFRRWVDVVDEAIYSGRGARGSLEVMLAAFSKLDPEMKNSEEGLIEWNKALDDVALACRNAGLAWGEAANGLDKIALAQNLSLGKLKEYGYLVESVSEEQNEALPVWRQGWNALKATFAQTGQSLLRLTGLAKKNGEETEKAAKKGHNAFDGLGKKLLSVGALFFTARKLVQYFRNALERAPDDLITPYNKLKENIRNLFDRSAVSGLAAMQSGLERLNELMESPAGQKFASVMAHVGYIIGTVVGGALDLLVQLIGMVIDAFGQMGISAEQVVSFIATIAAGLFVTLYNIVATMYNVIASFAEFLVNVWNDPAGAIKTLFWRLADAVLGFIQSIGDGFDALMAKLGISTGVGGWLAGVRSSAQSKLNESLSSQNSNSLVLDRMELKNYEDTAQEWATKAGEFDPMSLELKAINQNTRSAAKSAASIDKALQDADIKALIDVAERKFVSMVNLTSQTPVITVNGANTGNTQQDRINLANAIRDILLEQLAVGSTTSSAAYGV